MKNATIILLIFGAVLWIVNYYSIKNAYKELKANPIHDTVYVLQDIRLNTNPNYIPVVWASLDSTNWILVDTPVAYYKYYKLTFVKYPR